MLGIFVHFLNKSKNSSREVNWSGIILIRNGLISELNTTRLKGKEVSEFDYLTSWESVYDSDTSILL